MKIDPEEMRQAFASYVQTPAGKQWLDNVGYPGWMLLIASALQAFLGWCMMCTIILIPWGLRMLISGLTFKPYRHSLAKKIQANPEALQVIPGCGVIVGPSGAALILGSLAPIELHGLVSMASKLGELYANGASVPSEEELATMLRDDAFQFNRRRRVPGTESRGLELFLFDTRLDKDQSREIDDGVILGLAITPGEEGVHVQVPWDAIKSAMPHADAG